MKSTSIKFTLSGSVLLEFDVLIKARLCIQWYIRSDQKLNSAFERYHYKKQAIFFFGSLLSIIGYYSLFELLIRVLLE